jgi:hypothetical protein
MKPFMAIMTKIRSLGLQPQVMLENHQPFTAIMKTIKKVKSKGPAP